MILEIVVVLSITQYSGMGSNSGKYSFFLLYNFITVFCSGCYATEFPIVETSIITFGRCFRDLKQVKMETLVINLGFQVYLEHTKHHVQDQKVRNGTEHVLHDLLFQTG